MSDAPRARWSGRSGFVLAAIGSAVGLGNMWRFSYLAAEHGGAAFVVLYLALTLVVGLPVLLAELTLGRGAQQSPIRALAHYGGAAWRPLGALFVACGFLILAYYSVIAGWTIRYALGGIVGGFAENAGERFSAIASGPAAIGWHVAFMILTMAVVAGGVKRGIERIALVLMPALFGIVVCLAIYAASLDGAAPGYAYYLRADFSEILSLEVLSEAAGQAFFSLSLGMGAMLTFASYLDRTHHLPNESVLIGGSDFGVAFVSGLVVFPVIFAFGLQGEVGASTVGALFITLPQAFASMGPAGNLVGVLFFVALVFGALTSAISLLEVVVSSAIDVLGWSRQRSVWLLGGAIALLGIPAATSLDVLGLMDQIAGNVLLVFGGLALALFVGWVMKDPVEEARQGTEGIRWFPLWRGLLRFVVPLLLLPVLYTSIRATIDTISGLVGD